MSEDKTKVAPVVMAFILLAMLGVSLKLGVLWGGIYAVSMLALILALEPNG